jgi:SRSO17 transposase
MKTPPSSLKTREERFEHYLALLGKELDRADRIKPFREYLTGLLLPGNRKSIEPLAAQIDPSRVCAKHQSLHHFIAAAAWSDRALLRALCQYALPALLHLGEIECWLLDDTGFPKRGKHSVGVARQYCGQLGKIDNCQVAVSLTLSHQLASLPIALELYLPKNWAHDWVRRKKAGVPREIRFRTKHDIALTQIDAALRADLPRALVNADAGFGNNGDFRDALTARRLPYAVGIRETTMVWPPGKRPLAPPVSSPRGRGQPPKLLRRDAEHQPLTVRQLADQLGRDSFRPVAWREGARGEMCSHFCTARVRPANRDFRRETPRAEEWLLIEWPVDERDPTKYWFLTLPRRTSLRRLVYAAKGRWPIERDYEELKDLGLGGYEVRGWRGFHHHTTMCIAAYAFLIAERGLFSPSPNRRESRFTFFGISGGQRSHGSSNTNGAAQSNFDCDDEDRIRCGHGQPCASMPVLPKIDQHHVIIS